MFRRFIRDTVASVGPVFAVATIPLISATGAAVDYSQAFQTRTVVQDALDSAALAGGKKIGVVSNDAAITEAEKFFDGNLSGKVDPIPVIDPDITGSTITLTTTLEVPTTFLSMLGIDDLSFSLRSQATQGIGTLEVALVLDTSGSMYGTKLTTLKSAANSLVTTIYNLASTSTKPDPVKVSVVPFAGSVNVGPSFRTNATATWLDKTGIGTYHADGMDGAASTVSNFSLFTALNKSWGGCVEQRPMPYDATDDEATSTVPSTMFVPMFAPDEPDNFTCSSSSSCTTKGSGNNKGYAGAPSGSQSYNNYLRDSGGNCGYSSSSTSYYTGGSNTSETSSFARTCKYNSASVTSITFGTGATAVPGGPNFLCNSTAITPLTTTKATITGAINSLVALGATAIDAGVAWGWRVLSPTAPFTEGRAYGTEANKKIMVVMTDGENTYYPNSKFLKSWYGEWGYVYKNHLGSTSTDDEVLEAIMIERTKLACDHAKTAGVTIYTVGFDINAGTVDNPSAALSMLQYCASGDDKYFNATNNSALTAAFTAIGDSISQLRLAE